MELEALQFVQDFWSGHHHAPTMRDVQAGLGLSSSSLANYRIAPLLRMGLLGRCERCAAESCRTMYVTMAGHEWLNAATPPPVDSPPPVSAIPTPSGGA